MRNLSDGKKCVICFALVILMGLLLFYTYTKEEPNQHAGIIRLHVIANSDSAEDQALKLKVRDAVVKYVQDNNDSDTVELSRQFLEINKHRLEKIAEGVIAAQGYDYGADADLGVCFIPEKTYGDITFPAGNYEAMNITLGNGDGQNWWCVLFPPLCLLEEGTEQLPDEEAAKLELKWKVLELVNNTSSF